MTRPTVVVTSPEPLPGPPAGPRRPPRWPAVLLLLALGGSAVARPPLPPPPDLVAAVTGDAPDEGRDLVLLVRLEARSELRVKALRGPRGLGVELRTRGVTAPLPLALGAEPVAVALHVRVSRCGALEPGASRDVRLLHDAGPGTVLQEAAVALPAEALAGLVARSCG